MPFVPPSCPNPGCPRVESPAPGRFYWCRGTFARGDKRRVRRFQCKACRRHFSEQTFAATWRRRRDDVDDPLRSLLDAGVSRRAAARLLGVNRKTVQRRASDPRWAKARPSGRRQRGPGPSGQPA